jgi:hypothetical protein
VARSVLADCSGSSAPTPTTAPEPTTTTDTPPQREWWNPIALRRTPGARRRGSAAWYTPGGCFALSARRHGHVARSSPEIGFRPGR